MSENYRNWAQHVASCPICDADDEDECEEGARLRRKVQRDDFGERDTDFCADS